MNFFLFFHLLMLVSFKVGEPCEMITVEDYENYAKLWLPLGSREYLQRGADKDFTLNRNNEAFSKIKVIPRYLQDVSNRTTTAEALGKSYRVPIGIAPSGLQKGGTQKGNLQLFVSLILPEKESIEPDIYNLLLLFITVHLASSVLNTIMIVSCASSVSFENIAKEAPNAEKWMQIFLFDNRTITYDFVKQAENLKFGAIVVTVDDPVSPLRYFNKKNGYKDQHKMINFEKYFDENGKQQILKMDKATWMQLQELVNSTILPVIMKGILTSDDARLAYEHGAKGIIVSNHGGRQLDGTISSIEALSIIVADLTAELKNGFEIYLDSGVRSGLDVFRALAIGAKFVFVGRASIWGLFHSGQKGVEVN